MESEFAMEPIAMSDQDIRELTCVGHEAELHRYWVCSAKPETEILRCKHCHKELGKG